MHLSGFRSMRHTLRPHHKKLGPASAGAKTRIQSRLRDWSSSQCHYQILQPQACFVGWFVLETRSHTVAQVGLRPTFKYFRCYTSRSPQNQPLSSIPQEEGTVTANWSLWVSKILKARSILELCFPKSSRKMTAYQQLEKRTPTKRAPEATPRELLTQHDLGLSLFFLWSLLAHCAEKLTESPDLTFSSNRQKSGIHGLTFSRHTTQHQHHTVLQRKT